MAAAQRKVASKIQYVQQATTLMSFREQNSSKTSAPEDAYRDVPTSDGMQIEAWLHGQQKLPSYGKYDTDNGTGGVGNVTARALQQEQRVRSRKTNVSRLHENDSSSYQPASPAMVINEMHCFNQWMHVNIYLYPSSDGGVSGRTRKFQRRIFDPLVGKQEGNLTLNEGVKVGNSNGHKQEPSWRRRGKTQRVHNARVRMRNLFKRLEHVLRCGDVSKAIILQIALQKLIAASNEVWKTSGTQVQQES